ncbi:hypothetical protein BCR33DRAFT_721690 [Rhizoclosmatium globosum]|uniref:Ribosomal protein L22 n=1 Tax=Rhizoclosmatium globosum TaxID=329046 RepID=A0A1Y2BQL9_9FUNG|nr:hypothetical protein BCR33DRAFT_721690 [Rhizoclosmatium globosum]|eukprot:ORY37049.1 hypothetical protein BCR33DRAFT_721690 [Rhizoclosmatium globosum]
MNTHRFFSSTTATFALKPHVLRTTVPTPPNVYAALRGALETSSSSSLNERQAAIAAFAAKNNIANDAAAARAFDPNLVSESSSSRTKDPHSRLVARLTADPSAGPNAKVSTFRVNVLHMHYSRFVPLLSDLRGLSLADAFNQLRWLRKRVSSKVTAELEKALVKAKEVDGLDLNKTYVADAFVKPDGAVLSAQFKSRFLRGRGRYGSTQHPRCSLCSREADPLEWIRKRLRDRVAGGAVKDVEAEVYSKVAARRVVKEIHC